MALRTRARSTRLLVVALVSISLVMTTVDYREGNDGPSGVPRRRCARGDQPASGGRLQGHAPDRELLLDSSGCPRSVKSATSCANGRWASRPSSPRAERTRQGLDELEALFGLQESLWNRIETTAAQVIATGSRTSTDDHDR